MIDKIKDFLGRTYYPLNKIEINKKNLVDNYYYLSALSSLKIAPVVKSNAYGHGIEQVSKILDELNPPLFCVDSIFEAYQLKKIGIKSHILIMGFVDMRNLKKRRLPFSFTTFNLDFAKALSEYQPGAKIHIKVDTGMNRIGVQLNELENFLSEIKKLDLKIEGLMSHFSSPRSSRAYTQMQIRNFKYAKKIFEKLDVYPRWIHIAASGALFNANKTTLGHISNLARCGIALYGSSGEGNTKAALELKTQIVQIKYLPKGVSVGYDRSYKTAKETLVGILPMGYNDGIDRRLSNNGFVNCKGVFCPIIGRVSMNITTIDITEVKNPKNGDEVVVISSRKNQKNSITSLAKYANTIPHDLLVHLHAKALRRVVI